MPYPQKESHIEVTVLGCCSYSVCYPSKFNYLLPTLMSRAELRKDLLEKGYLTSVINMCFGLTNYAHRSGCFAHINCFCVQNLLSRYT